MCVHVGMKLRFEANIQAYLYFLEKKNIKRETARKTNFVRDSALFKRFKRQAYCVFYTREGRWGMIAPVSKS